MNSLNVGIRRIFDLIFSILGLVCLSPVLGLLYLIGLLHFGSPLFKQVRVGQNKRTFVLVKFRTMPVGTKSVPTHLIQDVMLSRYGRLLRKTKLDELPQLWNVLKGDMSLVGPRPCLVEQSELISEREAHGVLVFRPGITGLAQINAIDMSNPILLTKLDKEMCEKLSIFRYFVYIFATVFGKGTGDRTIQTLDSR